MRPDSAAARRAGAASIRSESLRIDAPLDAQGGCSRRLALTREAARRLARQSTAVEGGAAWRSGRRARPGPRGACAAAQARPRRRRRLALPPPVSLVVRPRAERQTFRARLPAVGGVRGRARQRGRRSCSRRPAPRAVGGALAVGAVPARDRRGRRGARVSRSTPPRASELEAAGASPRRRPNDGYGKRGGAVAPPPRRDVVAMTASV